MMWGYKQYLQCHLVLAWHLPVFSISLPELNSTYGLVYLSLP